MSLRQSIIEAKEKALKEKDEKSLSVLRMLWSAIKNVEIDKKEELGDDQVQEVVQRQVKQLKDALKDFESAGRDDLVSSNKKEIEFLEKYLPTSLSVEELEQIVQKIAQDNEIKEKSEFGKLMGLVIKEVKGRADGNDVKDIVTKQLL